MKPPFKPPPVVKGRATADTLPHTSELRFSRLFELSPLPMCYTSESDGFATTQWNLAWFSAFGFEPRGAQGKSGLVLGIWRDPEQRHAMLGRSLGGQGANGIEVQMRRANGELRWISLSTRIFMEPQGALVLVSFFDVTDVRDAQRHVMELNSELERRVVQRTTELQNANQELSRTLEALKVAKDQLVQSEKLAALGALVAGVAHELNTPIGNGLTVASALEDKAQRFNQRLANGLRRSELQQFVDDTRQAADILVRNLGRTGALVTSFKQVAMDQTNAQRRRFSLPALVSEVLLTLTSTTGKTGCTVTSHIEEELWLDSYPGALGQVFTHLIHNALLHGFNPQEAGQIGVRAWSANPQQVITEVRDNGRGIHPDHLHRVFEPFFTTRMGQGGSGLGLHIVHNLVTHMLGGSIELHSQPGQGTRLTLKLPVSAPLSKR
jgi:PAS domain S-box-containing protein